MRHKRKVVRRRRHRMHGGFLSWVKKAAKSANRWLKKNKVLSRAAGLYGKFGSNFGLPYTSHANKGSKYLRMAGYGSGYRRGGGVRLAGRGPGLAGGRRRRRRKK
jgi:hypothetical protein